jgi:uncharacterized protein YkwD
MTATDLVRGRPFVRAAAALLATSALILVADPTQASAQIPCPGSDAAPSAQTLPSAAGEIVCLVNAHRATHGLRPLTANADLAQAAGRHSRDMVRRAFFAHVTPTGKGPGRRIRGSGYLRGVLRWSIGENLAWGTGSLSTPDAIVAAWIASPAHERVLLDTQVREVGVGIAIGVPVSTPGPPNGATYTLDSGEIGH